MPSVNRPVLSLQTVYFQESDREAARELGDELYSHLTRREDDPLGYGPNIPVLVGVRADRVDREAADKMVLLPVMGSETYGDGPSYDAVIESVNQWHAELDGRGLVLPIPLSRNWLNAAGQFSGQLLRTVVDALPADRQEAAAGDGTDARKETAAEREERLRPTRDHVVMAVTRLLDPSPGAARMFISHAKADLTPVDAAATTIHKYVATSPGCSAFFDAATLRPGESLPEQLDEALEHGVLVVVRGDAHSSQVWCQWELLQAKLNKLPTVVVEILNKGERRSSPYGGNCPTLLWRGRPEPVVSLALVEWLRAKHFILEAARIIESVGLPDDVRIAGRHPELLDLAQGPLQSEFAQLVLHPDPELSVNERRVLRASHPRLHLVTPTTVFRRLLARDDAAHGAAVPAAAGLPRVTGVASPFEGLQVAMSLSVTPDADGPEGYTSEHVIDATIRIARTLISAGAAIAYGGNLRADPKVENYTTQLAQLIRSYNLTDTEPARHLHSYLASVLSSKDASGDLPIRFHKMADLNGIGRDAILPDPTGPERPPDSLYYSDMRRVMTLHTDARVILGGAATPRTENRPGYGGIFPGVVEEAWRSLQREQPLYVVGGFGGAGSLLAELFAAASKEIPVRLQEAHWNGSEPFKTTSATVKASPWFGRLGLPEKMDAMAQEIHDIAARLLQDDDTARKWNGLTVEENWELLRSRDPVTLALLIAKGLLAVTRRESAELRKIELVLGSVEAASKLDAIAIATLDGVPLGGAGAVLDAAVGGRASSARADRRVLISLEEGGIDADWLFMASLGRLDGVDDIVYRVERAARETAAVANQYGFSRLGVVTFGGGILPDTELIAAAMRRGFEKLRRDVTIVWFEIDEGRFELLKAHFSQDAGVKMTTQRALTPASSPPTRRDAVRLHVRLEGPELVASALLPSGSAIVAIQRNTFGPDKVDQFSHGSGIEGRSTPDLDTLQARGKELARLLFGGNAGYILEQCGEAPVIVTHDVTASKLPFETLATNNPLICPAVEAGMSRLLEVAGAAIEAQFARPPKRAPLELLLIVDPADNLSGAVREGGAVKAALSRAKAAVNVTVLRGKAEATKAAIAAALASADVLHYCGHAFFDGTGPGESGLELAHGEKLTGEDLKRITTLPRMAFVNACEASRVRGTVPTEAAAFAELFLRSGVDAYVGTFWRVRDDAAAIFAAGVYQALATGKTLDAAVLDARKTLHKENRPDWANYILFGGGGFRLVAG